MIRIRDEQLDKIRRHAEAEYPRECCGLLVGRIEDDGRTRVVVETVEVSNAWESDDELGHRMLITPQD